jgi:hypothetical protein
MTLLVGDTRPKALTDEMWIEIMDRLAPILGDVSQKSARWAMKKTRTPQMTPGTALSNASGTVTVLLDDGATVRARALGVAPALSGDRVMVMHMPPNAMFCFALYGFPTQGIELVTSSARPTIGLYAGRMIYESDTTKTMQYDATNSRWMCIARLSGVDTYTPTLRFGATAATVGNGTLYGNYWAIGNMIDVSFNIAWGTTSSKNGGSGTFTFTLPSGFPMSWNVASNPFPMLGNMQCINAGVGRTARFAINYTDGGSDYVAFGDMVYGQGLVSDTSPFTNLANGNSFHAVLRYRWTA